VPKVQGLSIRMPVLRVLLAALYSSVETVLIHARAKVVR
jgi:hypothetical protein